MFTNFVRYVVHWLCAIAVKKACVEKGNVKCKRAYLRLHLKMIDSRWFWTQKTSWWR